MALSPDFRAILAMMYDTMLRELDVKLAHEIAIFQRGSIPHAAQMILKGAEKCTAIANELEHRRIARWPLL